MFIDNGYPTGCALLKNLSIGNRSDSFKWGIAVRGGFSFSTRTHRMRVSAYGGGSDGCICYNPGPYGHWSGCASAFILRA